MASPIIIRVQLAPEDIGAAGRQIARGLQDGLQAAHRDSINALNGVSKATLDRARQLRQQLDAVMTPAHQRAIRELQQIARQAETTARSVGSSFRDGFSAAFDAMKAKAAGVFASIRSAAGGLFSGLGGGGGGGGGGGILGTILGVAGGGLLGGAISTVLGGIAGQLKGVVSAGIDFNATIESAGISLKRLLGSSAAATAEIERLKKDALASPIDFTQLLALDQQLLNAGFSARTLRESLTGFTQGTALIAGTKDLAERIGGIGTALSQMANKGKASNEELSQLAERQIPVYKILAAAVGKTTDEIFRLAESGQLDGLRTAEIIFRSIAREAANAGPEISKSFAVLSSNLNDLFEQTSGQATQNIFGSLKRGLETLTGPGAQGLAQSVAAGVNTITAPLTQGFNSALDALSSGNFFERGQQIVSGLRDGIAGQAQSAWDAMKGVGQGVIDTLNDVLQMKSPSLVMQERGRIAADSFTDVLVDRTSEGFKRWGKAIERAGGDEFIKAIEAIARRVGANPNELLNVLAFESRFNPQARNPRGTATGLIQFTAATARGLGTSVDALAQQSAIEQLAFVEKYLRQFKQVLDTQEKLYTSVLAGKPAADPETVLFRAGTKAFTANRELDRNRDQLITAAEASFQARKQGFTTPGGQSPVRLAEAVTEARQLNRVLVDTVPVVSNINAQAALIPHNFEQIGAELNPLPGELGRVAAETASITAATSKAAEQAANFRSIWKDPLEGDIKKVRAEIEQIGQNMESKAALVQLQAIRDLAKADEDAVLNQIRSRVELADKTIFHSARSNAAVLGHLNQQTRGITEIVSDAKIGLIDAAFGFLDRGVQRITGRLGALRDVVSGILSSLLRLALNNVVMRLLGLSGGGGQAGAGSGLSLAGLGGGQAGAGLNINNLLRTPSFAGGGGAGFASLFPGVASIFGQAGNTLQAGPSLTRTADGLPLLPNILVPALGGGGGGNRAGGILGALGLGNLRNLFQGFGLSNAQAGTTLGPLAAAAPLLGLSLGAGLGGQSVLGQILGGAGGLLAGVGLTAAPAGLAGLGLGALAPLFSNPFTIAAGVALLVGSFFFGRAQQRRKDEEQSGVWLQDAVDNIHKMRDAAKAGQLTNVEEARSLFETNIIGQFVSLINTLQTRSVRESRLTNQVRDLRNLFDKEVVPHIQAAVQRQVTRVELIPEFHLGGFNERERLAVLLDNEMVLTTRQQQQVMALAGYNVFQTVGVPNAGQLRTDGLMQYHDGARSVGAAPYIGFGNSGDSAPIEITLNIQHALTAGQAEGIVVMGLQGPNARRVNVKLIQNAKSRREL